MARTTGQRRRSRGGSSGLHGFARTGGGRFNTGSRGGGRSSQPDSVRSGQGSFDTDESRNAVGSGGSSKKDKSKDSGMSPSEGAQAGAELGARLAGPAGALLGGVTGYAMASGDSQGNEPVGSGRRGSGGRSTQPGSQVQSESKPAPDPKPQTDPAPPTPDSRQGALAEIEEEQRRNRQRGRASTILTGGRGLMDQPSLAVRTLMGS